MSEISVVRGLTRKFAPRQNRQFTPEQIRRLISPYHRGLLEMFKNGLSYQQMADFYGVPRGTIKSGLYRAREALNKLV